MPRPKSITHLIVRLDTGGAEKSLYRLVRGTCNQLKHHIICFGPPSQIGLDIAELGATVTWLDYQKLGPLVIWRAWRLLRDQPPDVLQGWMYFGNLIASVLALGLPGRSKLAWNIRQSPADFAREKRRTRFSIAIARLSWLRPDLVIYNSFAGRQAHERFGFNRGANVVISNGIDLNEFKPAVEARERWRAAHGVGEAQWVGLVCRFHPLKGVGEFLQAVRLLRDQAGANMQFVLAGPGMAADNSKLMALFERYGVGLEEVELLGPINDPAQFLPGLDLVVIASVREGTPNILLEAMACGVNTVATRVGDVARILRDPARIARPGDAVDLAQKIAVALENQKDEAANLTRVAAERAFIQRFYETGTCMAAYLENYQELLN